MHPGPVRTRWQMAVAVVAAIAGMAGLSGALTGERVPDRLHEDELDYVTATIQLKQHGVLAFSAPTAPAPAPSEEESVDGHGAQR